MPTSSVQAAQRHVLVIAIIERNEKASSKDLGQKYLWLRIPVTIGQDGKIAVLILNK